MGKIWDIFSTRVVAESIVHLAVGIVIYALTDKTISLQPELIKKALGIWLVSATCLHKGITWFLNQEP
jgi:hypothetical protein